MTIADVRSGDIYSFLGAKVFVLGVAGDKKQACVMVRQLWGDFHKHFPLPLPTAELIGRFNQDKYGNMVEIGIDQ